MSSNVAMTRCVVAELNPEKRYVKMKTPLCCQGRNLILVIATGPGRFFSSLSAPMQACFSVHWSAVS
jgi:hypothetical protein